MSEPPSHTTIPIFGGPTLTVQGALPDEGALQNATRALLEAGFDRNDLSLPTTGREDPGGSRDSADQQDVRQVRTTATGTIGAAGALIGGTIAAVATGGAAIPAAVAAVAAAAGAGGLAHMGVRGSTDEREAAHDAKGASGTLILSTIVRDAQKEAIARKVLQDAGATRVETVERALVDTRTA